MKSSITGYFLISCIAVCAFGLGCMVGLKQKSLYLTLRKWTQKAQRKLGAYPQYAKEKPPFYLLGDSLVKRGDWRGLEAYVAPVNLGEGGARVIDTYNTLSKLESVSGGRALLLVGLNNFADRNAIEKVLKDYEKLLVLCNEKGLDPAICSIPEVIGTGGLERRPAIRILNESLESLAVKYNLVYMDINKHALLDSEGDMHEGMTIDRLHLSTMAYEKIVRMALVKCDIHEVSGNR